MFKKYDPAFKEFIVKEYKNNRISLRKLAQKNGVSWMSIWRWVKEEGNRKFLSEAEERAILLKERIPYLKLREIKRIIYENYKTDISLKKLWYLFNNKIDKKTKILPPKYFKYRNLLFKLRERELQREENLFVLLKEIRKIRKYFEKNKFYFSLSLSLLKEMLILEWYGRPKEIIKISKKYKTLFLKIRNTEIKADFFISRAIAYAQMGEIEEAYNEFKIFKKIIRGKKEDRFILPEISFYSFLEENFLVTKKLEILRNKRDILYPLIKGFSLTIEGKYRESLNMLKKSKIKNIIYYITKAYSCFFIGAISEARSNLEKAYKIGKKNELHLYLFEIYFIYLLINMLYIKEKEKNYLLKKLTYLTKKYDLGKKERIIRAIRGQKSDNMRESRINSLKIIETLKNNSNIKKLKALLNFCYTKQILGILHRYIWFFPKNLEKLISYTNIKLPRTLTLFPFFSKDKLVLHIDFLGKIKIYRNNREINTKLYPKETAILLYIADKADSPKKTINIKEICENFFKGQNEPQKQLNLYLYRIRKKLKIPFYYLKIENMNGKKVIKNNGIYFTTDFQEFKDTILRAKFLLKEGNYEFSKKEFLRALKLFRGKPYEKMYDDFSDFQRILILNTFEDEMRILLREVQKRKDLKFQRLIEKKIQKILF